MVTLFVVVVVVIGVAVGVLIYLKNKDKPPNRFNAIPTEERNAQLEARYQRRLKDEQDQQPPTA
ncbi:MAG: hypothetical protein ACR2KJ_14405 [Jatrophihabitans sp.]